MLNRIIIGVLLVMLFLAVFNGYRKDKEIDRLQLSYNGVVYEKDSLNNIIAVKDAEIVTNQESMKELRERLFQTTDKYNRKVNEVKALIAQKTKVIIKDKLIPYKDTSGRKEWEDSISNICRDVISYYEDSTVLVGTKATDSTDHYNISLTILKEGVKIDSISLIDSQYLSITEFKGGLFKRNTQGKLCVFLPKKIKVEIKHTNPYFVNNGISAFFYEKKKKNLLIPGMIIGGAATLLLLW